MFKYLDCNYVTGVYEQHKEFCVVDKLQNKVTLF